MISRSLKRMSNPPGCIFTFMLILRSALNSVIKSRGALKSCTLVLSRYPNKEDMHGGF